jgi:protein ImuB
MARACSPRVEVHGEAVVIFDASGLGRVLGSPADIAREVSQLATGRGVTIRVALAPTSTAAWLLAHATPGATVVAGAEEAAAALSGLPLRWLATLPDYWIFSGTRSGSLTTKIAKGTKNSQERSSWSSGASWLTSGGDTGSASVRPSARHFRMAPGPSAVVAPDFGKRVRGPSRQERAPEVVLDLLATFERWGLRTLGEVARLPCADVHARMGPPGVRLHQAACGEETAWLVPVDDAPRFLERCVLDWPIEGLEPLSFVLARLLDPLSASLERADRGAVEVATRLQLVTRERHERLLHLPAPMRDARVLRTLILLDLESHPPSAGVDIVEVEVGVVPGRIVQGALLRRALPTPEDLSTLLARLGALMGETRLGAPVLVDTYDERRTAMGTFVPSQGRGHRAEGTGKGRGNEGKGGSPSSSDISPSPLPSALCPLPCTVLRRFRAPVAARVAVDRGAPVHVSASVATGDIVASAGPWRSSGCWWALDGSGWDRDEWDVELAGGACYRLARDRVKNHWKIEGEID